MLLAGPTSLPGLVAILLGTLVLRAEAVRSDAARCLERASRRGPVERPPATDRLLPHCFFSRADDRSNDSKPPKGNPFETDDQVEELFLEGLCDDETEEISFLPPYASGLSEEEEGEGEGEGEGYGAVGTTAAGPIAAGLDDGSESFGVVPIPRHFALGTVAIIRKLLEPAEVAQILMEQKRQPKLRFGEIGIQLDLLTESQLQELLLAQQQGLFTDVEIREARMRLRAYREFEASAS